jgi:hypothetical protein
MSHGHEKKRNPSSRLKGIKMRIATAKTILSSMALATAMLLIAGCPSPESGTPPLGAGTPAPVVYAGGYSTTAPGWRLPG